MAYNNRKFPPCSLDQKTKYSLQKLPLIELVKFCHESATEYPERFMLYPLAYAIHQYEALKEMGEKAKL